MRESQSSTEARNICAGPFGAVYDYYIERPWLARLVLGLMWGVDPRPFYRSLAAVGEAPEGATILDVPCGGGVALRGLRPDQHVCWIGVDVEPAMLHRARRTGLASATTCLARNTQSSSSATSQATALTVRIGTRRRMTC